MVHRLALRVLAALIAVLAFSPGLPAATAHADPVMVYPGMEILQENRLCTLGYVDPVQKIAYTAGHCRSGARRRHRPEPQRHRPPRDLPGRHAQRHHSDDRPGDRRLGGHRAGRQHSGEQHSAGRTCPAVQPECGAPPGEAVCHFGVVTGETCGTVESVNNGWFTMSHGVQSHPGDSGGPVYTAGGGPAQIVGIFNSVWGDLPAAVLWQTTSQQVRQDLGAAAAFRPQTHR